jgi:hypothetical protein
MGMAKTVPADGLSVDGVKMVVVEVGHSDGDNTTVLHVPSIGLVVAGDVVYNNVHQYLAESSGGGLDAWLHALDIVEAKTMTRFFNKCSLMDSKLIFIQPGNFSLSGGESHNGKSFLIPRSSLIIGQSESSTKTWETG